MQGLDIDLDIILEMADSDLEELVEIDAENIEIELSPTLVLHIIKDTEQEGFYNLELVGDDIPEGMEFDNPTDVMAVSIDDLKEEISSFINEFFEEIDKFE